MKAPLASLILAFSLFAVPAAADPVRVKDLGHFLGWRDNALVGYGIVTGLAGSGDSARSEVTQQALKNVLSRFGANITPDQVRSRNVAAVMVTATFPPSANVGDHIDVMVSSIGDARSLMGGSLLMTPLMGPDQRSYALAQGPLVVGGYRFDANANVQQKNHPTSGMILGGATVETEGQSQLVGAQGDLTFVLKDPDFTTAERLSDGINASFGPAIARVRNANSVSIQTDGRDIYRLISRIEAITISPDSLARVVVNERSGTVVAGGGVRISSVVISQGDIKVSVNVENQASQPALSGGYAPEVSSLIISNTKLEVTSPRRDAVVRFPNTTVADLVEGLARVHVDTRGMIAVLQAIKTAGALHADIIVQ